MYSGKIEKSTPPLIAQSFTKFKEVAATEETFMFVENNNQKEVRAKIYSKIEQITAPLQKIACFDTSIWGFYLKPTEANQAERKAFINRARDALEGHSVNSLSYEKLSPELKDIVRAFVFMSGNDWVYEIYAYLGEIFKVEMPDSNFYDRTIFCDESGYVPKQFNKDFSCLQLILYGALIDPALKDNEFLGKLARNFMRFLSGVKEDITGTGLTTEFKIGETVEFYLEDSDGEDSKLSEEVPIEELKYEQLIAKSITVLYKLYEMLEETDKAREINLTKVNKLYQEVKPYLAKIQLSGLISEEEHKFYLNIIEARIAFCQKTYQPETKEIIKSAKLKEEIIVKEEHINKFLENRVLELEHKVENLTLKLEEKDNIIAQMWTKITELSKAVFSPTANRNLS